MIIWWSVDKHEVHIIMDSLPLPVVDNFSYPGALSNDGKIDSNVSNRLNKGGKLFQSTSSSVNIWLR